LDKEDKIMEKKIEKEYLPFHAVNEFMRDDYRLTILQEVLMDQGRNSTELHQRIGRMISKGVQIPGFRNSNLAPVRMKVKNSTTLFERSPEFAAAVMEAWSNLHADLKAKMADLLTSRNWVIPPVDEDHSHLPGFQLDWPKADTFEALIEALKTLSPDLQESDDNISLMAVWVGNRLPYHLYGDQEGTD